MPVRIYALAKELSVDSKALVDLCAQAGVSGKGSALASLTDDEVETVRTFVKGGGRTATRTAASSATLSTASSRSTTATESVAMRRENYIPPTGVTGKPKVLESKASKPPAPAKKQAGDGSALPAKSGPSVRLAAIPDAPQPSAIQPADEPAPQKPDLKLPPDAIRASKSGEAPLAKHLRKHEEKRHADEVKKSAKGRQSPAPAPVSEPKLPAAPGKGRRGGPPEKEASQDSPFGSTLGGREQRQLRRKRVESKRRVGDEDERRPRKSRLRPRKTGRVTALPRKGTVTLQLPCTVRSFSEAVGVPARQVLGSLLSLGTGIMPTINANLDAETAELLAEELGVQVELKQQVTLEDQMLSAIELHEDSAESLQPRPPVITFLGHVDHGKTSLLDRIIGIDVVSGESGGITQHIRAYQTDKDGRKIAFVDTPGHEAFTEMRARGANVTDIAVLVVAAEDGVMPQTEEAISHARAAGVPIVVAMNKIDLPNANPDHVMQQLATAELLPTEWGGDTEVVRTSATTGQGIDDLLETLLTIAELNDYRANPDRDAYGTCLEAQQEAGRGVIAKVIVQTGTLRVGDRVVCGSASGRVKAMYDTLHPDQTVSQAGPSTPVNITGLDEAPAAGEHFYVLDDIAKAREIASRRRSQARQVSLGGVATHVTLENLFDRLAVSDEVQTLNLILRADVRGSIEAIEKELTKLEHPEVKIKVLQSTVGGITVADVHLADASDAIILGFNVVPEEGARLLAKARGVQIRRYDIIYKLTEDLKAALEGMLKPEERESELGRALVQRTFVISRVGTVAGCRVLAGTIERNARVRVTRNGIVIGDYPLDTLRREKDQVRDVREGMECGIKLAGFNDVKEGDVLEAYKIEEFARTL